MVVSVIDFDDDIVVVDGNHPLAGVTLHFDVKIHEVRPATPTRSSRAAATLVATSCGCDHDE